MTDDLARVLHTTKHLRWVISRIEEGRETSIVDFRGVTHRVVWNRQHGLWIRACDDGFSEDPEAVDRQVDCMACVTARGDTP
jgi:hypothetical protein